MNVKIIVQGYGAAMLLMIARLAPLVSPYHALLYHSMLPMYTVIWGVLIDLAVLSLLTTFLFYFLQKDDAVLRSLAWALIAATLANRVIATMITTLGWDMPGVTPARAFMAILVGALVLLWVRPESYRAAVRGMLVALLLVGVTAVWMVPELLYQGLRTQRIDTPKLVQNPVAANRALVAQQGGRIVWLLFDELSYDQTFEHRFAGLALPSFDKFKRESIVFTNLQPVAYSTELVIPSLFLGKPVAKIRSDLDGDARVRFSGSAQWQAFDADATVFSDGHRLNWTTGIVGWFNPYCRILGATLDSCFWRMADGELEGPLPDRSALQNAIAPLQSLVWELTGKPRFLQRKHAEDLAAIMPEAKALIRNQEIRFVFIHLPIPHPPGIYDRSTGSLRTSGTYIDNLALSDRVLGELMATLDATSLATKTTVILCSDHSWRVPLWRPRPLWTEEEMRASHNRLDPRPVLMIHMPGEQTEQDVTTPFEEIHLHDILEHLLRGESSTFQSLY